MICWNGVVRSRTLLTALGLTVLGTSLALTSPPATDAEDKEQTKLQEFMRKKLDASSQVLEGLATEDHELIKEGADALYKMSAAEIFNVILDDDYREFNTEFRSSIRKLKDAAEKKNLDDATLQWIDGVKGCVECHKYVRSQRAVLK